MKYFLLGLKDYLNDLIHDLFIPWDWDWKEGNLKHYIYNRKCKEYSQIFNKHYINIRDIKSLKDVLFIVIYDAKTDIELAKYIKDNYEYYMNLSEYYNVVICTAEEYSEMVGQDNEV
jgi:hypothetical protein